MTKKNYGLQRLMISGVLMIAIPMVVALVCSIYTARFTINRSTEATEFSVLVSSYYDSTKQLKKYATDYFISLAPEDIERYKKESENIDHIMDEFDTDGKISAVRQIRKMKSMLNYLNKPITLYEAGSIDRERLLEAYARRYNVVTSSKELSYDAVADYSIQQMDTVNRIKKTMNNLTTVFFLVSVMMIIFSFVFMKKLIINPIVDLEKNVQFYGNNGYVLLPTEGYTKEINSLNRSFSEMAERINHTMSTMSENARLQEENLIAQNNISKLRFRNLQAQINPHFLFNTLSMISNVSLQNNDNEVYELMQCLTKFLRYALDNLITTSTIGQELDAIENYLFIQKKRFGDKILFSIECDSEFSNIEIPAITLQPLIENSISHGMTINRPITIRVFIEKEDNLLILGVEDDGVGMNAEKIESLYESISQDYMNGLSKSSSIGLSNVYGRYKSMFGNKMQFYIESEDDCGTCITIKIPCEG